METNIQFKWDRESANYEIPISINGQDIMLKFDTGASSSIISFNYFKENISNEVIDIVVNYCEKNCKIKQSFIASTGDSMIGYLVDAGQIKMGKNILPHFYYYFIPKNNKCVALLGNDFLHYCEYSHKICGDIIISNIDMNEYQKKFQGAINGQELINYINYLEKQNKNYQNYDDELER